LIVAENDKEKEEGSFIIHRVLKSYDVWTKFIHHVLVLCALVVDSAVIMTVSLWQGLRTTDSSENRRTGIHAAFGVCLFASQI
jgi:hypothetical protein